MRTAACVYEDHLFADDQMFEREVASCRRQLYPAALRLTDNKNDAEDLVQETLTRAYAGLHNFTPGTNARAWLYRIMSNAFVNACRKRRREPQHVLSDDIDEPYSTAVGQAIGAAVPSIQSAEDEALEHFAHSEIRDAVEELPDCFKATIYLADIVGYSYRDVAELTGVPIGTVMSRLHRARGRLRERLAARDERAVDTDSVATWSQLNRFRRDARVTPQPAMLVGQATSSASPVNAAHIEV